jgi:hypothetical protein
MLARKLLRLLCPTAGAICLAAGYTLAGQGIVVVLVALVWAAWVFAAGWPAGVLLAASVGLVVGGVWVGAAPALMLSAATLALASWDLRRWDSFVAGATPAVEARLARGHYACLALALGPAWLVALVGHLIQVQIPFAALVAVALLALVALDRVWRLVK